MAWTAPITVSSGSALTAAIWNTYVRDNLLETEAAEANNASGFLITTGLNAVAQRGAVTDTVSTVETTTSLTYDDLATVGPSVTLLTGTRATVFLNVQLSNNTAGDSARMAFEVSGDSSIAASDDTCIQQSSGTNNSSARVGICVSRTGLTPGTNTFTAMYRVSGGGTGTFNDRNIIVWGF